MAKRILTGLGAVLLWLLAVAVLTLPGCSSSKGLQASPVASNLVAQYATMKYIERAGNASDQVTRAARIRLVVGELERVAAGEALTVDRLAALALERVPAELTPADRMLALNLINLLQAELTARIGHGGLEPQTPVVLRELLRAVDQAAAFYAPS